MWRMAMGTRQSEQASLWVATAELPKSPGHPFYTRLNTLLEADNFDRFVEGQCARFYAPVMGRPSLAPGRYFRLLLVGYFEGIDSERGIAWRASDSLAVRAFLRLPVEEPPPDHTTISRTRRAIDRESHRAVFTWVQQRLVAAGLLKGKTVAIKDNVAVAGIPMMNGTMLLEGFVATIDATVVTRILDAGGSILGKSVCESLCFSGGSHTSDNGPVRNPHDRSRSTGGSSSGSGALVASGAASAAIRVGPFVFPALGVAFMGLSQPTGWCLTLGHSLSNLRLTILD